MTTNEHQISFGTDENVLKLWWKLYNAEYTKKLKYTLFKSEFYAMFITSQ